MNTLTKLAQGLIGQLKARPLAADAAPVKVFAPAQGQGACP